MALDSDTAPPWSLPPPEYILVASTALPAVAASPNAVPPTTLAHPLIQYHYADDPPFDTLPSSNERVIVLDLTAPDQPTAKSLSPGIVVNRLGISDAPGVSTVSTVPSPHLPEDLQSPTLVRNDKMFVIQVTTHSERAPDESLRDVQNPHAALARYKRRNAALRAVLAYPAPLPQDHPPLNSPPRDLFADHSPTSPPGRPPSA